MDMDEEVKEAIAQDMSFVPDVVEVPRDPPELTTESFILETP